MAEVKELIDHLSKSYMPTDIIAYDIWSVDDVMAVHKESGSKKKLSKEQAEEALEYVDRHKDATYGISWETLRCALDEVL